MGCLRFTYDQGEGLEKATVYFLGRALEKNPASSNFCNDYTPGGATFNSYVSGVENQYKYQGKEYQQEIQWYDNHARFYDPYLIRTPVPDPHAENYYDLSPYSWVANNPVNYADPDGMDVYVIINGESILAKKEEGDHRFVDNETGKDIDPFGQDWATVASSLDKASQNGFSLDDLGDSEQAGQLRKSVGLYNSMQAKNQFNDLADLITGLGGLRQAFSKGLTWWAKHFGDDVAEQVTKQAATRGTTVLGHFPEYMDLANKIGANRFSIPTKIWDTMTNAERWTANSKFLDRMIRRGDDIILATPMNKIKPGSYYAKEIEYLLSKGYKLSSDGMKLLKP